MTQRKVRITKANVLRLAHLKKGIRTKRPTIILTKINHEKINRFSKKKKTKPIISPSTLKDTSEMLRRRADQTHDDPNTVDMGYSTAQRLQLSQAKIAAAVLDKIADYKKVRHPTFRLSRFPSRAHLFQAKRLAAQDVQTPPVQRIPNHKGQDQRLPLFFQNRSKRSSGSSVVGKERFSGRIQTQVGKGGDRSPAYTAKETYSGIRTGRNVRYLSGQSSYSYARYDRNRSHINLQTTTDSGVEAIRGSRAAYRRTTNAIRTAKNTHIAVRKSIHRSKMIYSRVKTVVRKPIRVKYVKVKRTVRIRNIVSSVFQMKTNLASIALSGMLAVALLLILIINSLISSMASVINDTFGWLYRSGNSMLQEYGADANSNIHMINVRLKGVLEDPSKAYWIDFPFKLGYQANMISMYGAEYATAFGDAELNTVPIIDMVSLAIIHRLRFNQDEYTIKDFEESLGHVFAMFFDYNERESTFYHPNHGYDDDGNPIWCDGHPAILIYVKNYSTDEVMSKMNLTEEEKAQFQQYKFALLEYA